MRGAADAVDGGVAQVDVGAGHVDLRAQHHGAVFMLAALHFPEPGQVVCGCAAAKRAVDAGLAEVAPVDADFFHSLFVHVGVAGFNQIFGGAVHEIKVVAGLIQVRGAIRFPAKAQPLHRFQNAVDEFKLFFLGVGVVKAQVAHAAIVARQAKVQADAFGVADVQVAVGLGRKAGADFGGVALALGMVSGIARAAAPAAAGVGAGSQVVLDDLAQEVAGLGCVLVGRAGGFVGGGEGHAMILGGAVSGLRLATIFTVHAVGAYECPAFNKHMGRLRPVKEKRMKTTIKSNHSAMVAGAAAALALAAMGFASSAQARDNVYWSVGVGSPGVSVNVGNGFPVYVEPLPVYIQPRPVYVQPAPVYYRPAPVYVEPLPVYYGRPYGWNRRHGGHYMQAPRPGYGAGYAPVYYQRDAWHQDRREDRREDRWEDRR